MKTKATKAIKPVKHPLQPLSKDEFNNELLLALTPKEQQFADIYLATSSHTEAYRAIATKDIVSTATASIQGTKYLNRASVRAYIANRQEQLGKVALKNREQILKAIQQIAFSARFEARDRLQACSMLMKFQGYDVPKREVKAVQVEYISKAKGLQPTTLNPPEGDIIELVEPLKP